MSDRAPRDRELGARSAAEAQLAAVSEERLRLAVRGTNMGFYDLDIATGATVVSPEYATQLGYDAATFVPGLDTWARMIHPDDMARVGTLLRDCMDGRAPGYDTEYRLRTAASEWRWVQSVGTVLSSPATGRPERLLGIHIDIDARKRAEAVERESRHLYEDLVASIPMGVYRAQGQPDHAFRILYVNDKYCELLGLSREDILADARTTVARIHPDDVEGFAAANRAAMAAHERFTWEGRVVVNGATRRLHVTASPSTDAGSATWTGFILDITERHEADRALRESEYFLARSQEVTHIGSFDFDMVAGTWVCTPVLDDILGLPHRSPKSFEEWRSTVAPDMRDEMDRYVAEHVVGGRNRFDREYRIVRHNDGAERWLFGRADVEFDADGRPLRMIGTIQDITDRKRDEATRLELERRLLHAQKLESLGVLAGGIAHDFNNLLLAVIGNLDLALQQMSPAASVRSSLDQSMAAARRAADLTRQMLAYSGKAAFDVRPLDLNEVVHENAHLLRACIPKLVQLDLRLGPRSYAIVADPGQVQQVIMNLITNAAEAIGETPGTIILETRVEDVDAGRLRATRLEDPPPPGRFVCLEVTDSGCGMDTETQQRLFDPFFTTKLLGRGLGMSAILGIVRGHRGAIMVDSKPDYGTTIRVLFPAGPILPPQNQAEAAAARATAAAANAAPAGYVLIVDDEEMIRGVCRRMLETDGWKVFEADGGVSALELFAQHADDIACVLLDLSMPQMDGYAVLHKLQSIRPEVRVILSSGYNCAVLPDKDMSAAGFAGFIQKPYTARTLRDEVARVTAAVRSR